MGGGAACLRDGDHDDHFHYLYHRRRGHGCPGPAADHHSHFFPVARQLGYDPLWFGVTITVVTTLGAVTPPVGATTYVVGGMAKGIPLEEVFKGVTYFLRIYHLRGCFNAVSLAGDFLTESATIIQF